MAGNNNIWDNELSRLLQGHETEAPEGLWDELSESLDELNHELEFDESLRSTVNEAQLNPPADVWNAVQTGLGKASLVSGSVGLITKLVVTSLIVAGGITAWYFASETGSKEEISLSETVEPKIHQQEMQIGETLSEESLPSINKENSKSESVRDGFDETKFANTPVESRGNKSTSEPSESSYETDGVNTFESEMNPSQSNSKAETGTSRSSNNIPVEERENPVLGKPVESIFNISVEKNTVCAGERFTVYADNPGNKKGYVVLDGNRFLITGKENLLEMKAPATAGDYTVQCFDADDNPIPGAIAMIRVSSFEAEQFSVTDKGGAAFEIKLGSGKNITASTWKIDHKEAGHGNILNIHFSDKQITEHRVVLVQKSDAGCVDSAVGKILNKTIIAEPIIPNVFTPGGDGFNDEFLVKIEGEESFLLMIYDDNGTLLFKSEDKNKGWDGINPHTGAKCRGKYFAVLRYKPAGMAEKELIRSFTILQP